MVSGQSIDIRWVEAQVQKLRDSTLPAVAELIEDTDSIEEMQVVALGLLSEVASFCMNRMIGVQGRGSIEGLAAIDPEDAMWCIEALANLRSDDIRERATLSLSLPRRRS